MPGWDPSYISNFNFNHHWGDSDSCSPSINRILAKYGHDTGKQKRESASKTPGRDRQTKLPKRKQPCHGMIEGDPGKLLLHALILFSMFPLAGI